MMARSLHSESRKQVKGRRAPKKPWEEQGFDSSVSWGAELKQPSGRLSSGSIQSLVVEVSAPVVLEDQAVEFFYNGSWSAAEWIGEPGNTREAASVIEAKGMVHRVLVRVRSGQQLPIMFAGHVRVSDRG